MNFTSRFTLYDLLAMVFPGCFIIWSIMPFDVCNQHIHRLAFMSNIDCYIAFFVASYILGLGWNTIILLIWRKFIKSIQESCIDKAVSDKGKTCINFFNELPGETNAEKFNYAYTYVRLNDPHYTVDVVESQVSLLRNMAIPFAFWLGTIVYDKANNNTCCCIMLGIIVFFAIFSIAILRHYRKYSIVLSNYKNLKTTNEMKNGEQSSQEETN